MLEFTAGHLKCVKCASALSLEPIVCHEETEEGFLTCVGCRRNYPIISSVPLLVDDLSSYFSIRPSLAGQLLLSAKSDRMRLFVKETMRNVRYVSDDVTDLEKRWVGIYRNSAKSRFYTNVKKLVQNLPSCNLVLEHGCSIGLVSRHAAKTHACVFGIDKSFYGILEAKREQGKNSDFLVADSLQPPFGNKKFDLVVALNLLDIIEPDDLFRVILSQSGKFLIVSDPYDFERGKSSVKKKTTPEEVRCLVQDNGFELILGTKSLKHIPWRLNINPRLSLRYKVDLVAAQKKH